MKKNCEWCNRKFVTSNPRKRFCEKNCAQKAWRDNLPNAGHGQPEKWSHAGYWLTAKGYRAIGKKPPRAVVRTDREVGAA